MGHLPFTMANWCSTNLMLRLESSNFRSKSSICLCWALCKICSCASCSLSAVSEKAIQHLVLNTSFFFFYNIKIQVKKSSSSYFSSSLKLCVPTEKFNKIRRRTLRRVKEFSLQLVHVAFSMNGTRVKHLWLKVVMVRIVGGLALIQNSALRILEMKTQDAFTITFTDRNIETAREAMLSSLWYQ